MDSREFAAQKALVANQSGRRDRLEEKIKNKIKWNTQKE